MIQQHFISGLPRSGSTLLASILRQNPKISASMTSPAAAIFTSVQKAISEVNEASGFLTEAQKERHLKSTIENCCSDDQTEIRFDTNRVWTSKLPTLVHLYPECKIVCCVREISWIVDSIEKLVRKSPLQLSGLYGFDPNRSVFERTQAYTSNIGVIGVALNALKEGFFGEHSDRMLLIEYNTLTKFPKETIGLLYEWLEIERYDHDFENIQQIPGADEFDLKIGTKGLHTLMSKVQVNTREPILPPEIFNSFGVPFWQKSTSKAKIIK